MRLGLIGCGFFARNHLHAWREQPGVEVVAVCDADQARARAAAREFAVPAHYRDAAAMLAREQLDFVDIVTGAGSHRELVGLAVARRIHAICQKPFAPTLDEAVAMVAACRRAGVRLMVHENFRWQRAMRALKAELAARDYGAIRFARISFRSHWDVYAAQPYLAREERFIVADLGVHLLDLARFFLGEPTSLACRVARIDQRIRGEDSATIVLGFDEGATAVVDLSYATWVERELWPQTLVTLECDRGSLTLGADYRIVAIHEGEVRRRRARPRRLPWMDERTIAVQDSVLAIQRHWLECLRDDRDPETCGEDNLRTAALVEAAYESAAVGRTLRLTPPALHASRRSA